MTSGEKTEQILLGIDFGETNIGLAFGRNNLVSPMKIVSGKNVDAAIADVTRVVLENKVTKVVVGLPVDYTGKETPASIRVRQFVNMLKVYVKVPIVFVSEYDSTKQSLNTAIEAGASKKRRRSIDDISAAVILKTYFDED